MKIIRAHSLGMCFGVRDAITLAQTQRKKHPLTIIGELVHNPAVIRELEAQDIPTAENPGEIATKDVMITAHGASQKAIQDLEQRGHRVFEATCPLVHHAHKTLHSLVQAGYFPVVIGKKDHIEVRGMTGDLDAVEVILHPIDLESLKSRPKFGVVAQTTQPIAHVQSMVEALKAKFPGSEVRYQDTVCRPTKQRQNAAVELARKSDVMVIIGGSNSNNTRQLEITSRRHCERVIRIQNAKDLQRDWFQPGETVGITAGTSTPDSVIDEVERRLLLWSTANHDVKKAVSV